MLMLGDTCLQIKTKRDKKNNVEKRNYEIISVSVRNYIVWRNMNILSQQEYDNFMNKYGKIIKPNGYNVNGCCLEFIHQL